MKVALVSRCAWSLANFRAGLVRALRARSDLVLAAGAADGSECRLGRLGAAFTPLPVTPGLTPLADLRLFLALLLWYRREQPDVVHHFTIKPVIYGSLAARLAGVPRVVNTITGLGWVFVGNRRRWLRRLVEAQYRVAAALSDTVFFQNPEDRALFHSRRLVSGHKTAVVPGSGVDICHFDPAPWPADDRPPRFVMIARLLRDKGVYEFVAAAGLVRAFRPEIRLQLVGAPDPRNPAVVPADDLAEWQRGDRVECLPPRDDVRPLIAEATAIVLPSYREGLPRVALEAAAMARPAIVTDVPGCRTAVEDGVTGVLVPPRDAEALARAILWLADDPARARRMGEAARRKAEREFDEQIVIAATMASYEGAGNARARDRRRRLRGIAPGGGLPRPWR